jgi:hypothetical protein
MNERIRELAEQAGGEFYTGFAGSPNSVKFMEQDFEKFAELIVRECFHLFVSDHDEEHDEILESIKEHFGVKQ